MVSRRTPASRGRSTAARRYRESQFQLLRQAEQREQQSSPPPTPSPSFSIANILSSLISASSCRRRPIKLIKNVLVPLLLFLSVLVVQVQRRNFGVQSLDDSTVKRLTTSAGAVARMKRFTQSEISDGPPLVAKVVYVLGVNTSSPYEARTGDGLPDWAKKDSSHFLNNRNDAKSVCFVHVGKASGSTVACSLGFQYDCDDNLIQHKIPTMSRLRNQTLHMVHNWVNDCPHDSDDRQSDYYLFTLRDPIDRLRSWFTYERREVDSGVKDTKQILFFKCNFTTFSDLAERGLVPAEAAADKPLSNFTTSAVKRPRCHRLAFDVVRGHKPCDKHNFYNYQYYRNQAPVNATILAIRTEYMEVDWNSAEQVLEIDNDSTNNKSSITNSIESNNSTAENGNGGGDYGNEIEDPETNSSRKLSPQKSSIITTSFPTLNASRNITINDEVLSPKALKQLCRALCPEIKAYMDLISRAINLCTKQKKDSLDQLREKCPYQVKVKVCARMMFETH